MADKARQVDYFHISVPDKPGEAARVLGLLSQAGVNMIGFCAFPHGARRSQLDFFAEESAVLKRSVGKLGLKLSERKRAFVIQGTDRPGAIATVLNTLSQKKINVTSIQAVSSGDGAYGAMLWVKEPDVRKAAKALAALSALSAAAPAAKQDEDYEDIVDLASEQSFPASDPPPWT